MEGYHSRRERARHRALRRMPPVVTARSVQRTRQHLAAAEESAAARPPLRGVSPRAVLTGLAAAGLVGAATVAWLLAQASGAPPATMAQTRIDAVRTGLTAAAGTGGALALLLAARRQWLSERTQAHHEDVANDVRYDAAERRITELYTKAAEQMASAMAPVRLAGLYALERLAQSNSEHRQTIVSLFCAYLRMPYPLPGDDSGSSCREPGGSMPPEPGTESPEELQVRLAAQHILAAHLNPGPAPDRPLDSYWQDVDLNLAGATLVDFDLTGCRLGNAVFDRAVFTGRAKFSAARFSGTATFAKARFQGPAFFEEAQFYDVAFCTAEFDRQAWFARARFHGSAEFGGARFHHDADYTAAEFSGGARFEAASFGGAARFDSTAFWGEARFAQARFSS